MKGGGKPKERPPTPARLPLYTEARAAGPDLAVRGNAFEGHVGLWWDKFCDVWKENWSGPDEQVVREAGGGRAEITRPGKLEWMLGLLHRRQANRRVATTADLAASLELGEPARLDEAHARRTELFEAAGARTVDLELAAPFVTGTGLEHPTENGFVFHHTLAVPCIPASSLKGLVRAFAEQWAGIGAGETKRIFGPRAEGQALVVGSVVFFDALPLGPVRLSVEVTTPHYQPWYQADDPAARPPADWYDPVPIPFLVLAPGARFRFAVAPRRPGEEQDRADADAAFGWLRDALSLLGAGAKTALGFGRFEAPGERAKRDAELREQARAAADARPKAAVAPATAPAAPSGVAERTLGPARDFPVGTRVEHAGEEGVVVGYEGEMLVVDFDGEREPVDPGDVRRLS